MRPGAKWPATALVAVIAAASVLLPQQAFAFTRDDVRNEFSDSELATFFVEADDRDSGQFVMHDYVEDEVEAGLMTAILAAETQKSNR